MITLGVAALSGLLNLGLCCGGVEFSEHHAVQLDGSTGRINLDAAKIGAPATVTVEMWVKLDEVDRVQILVTDAFNDFNDGFSLLVGKDNRIIFFVGGFMGWSGQARGTTVLEVNRWYHVAGIYDADAGLIKVVLDGEQEGSVAYTQGIYHSSTRDLLFGMQKKPLNQSSRFLGGTLDEIRIWGVARTAEELEEARWGELSEEVEGLLGYWPLNEGSGLSAGDLSESGNDGLLQGGAVWVKADWVPELEVAIDIRPDDTRNEINMRSQGKIAVALLSSANLDVVEEIDRGSLTFGRTGDEDSLHRRGYEKPNCGVEDVNADGLDDLVCHFKTQSTGFQSSDWEGVLKGRTIDGEELTASDVIRVKSPGGTKP